jgi:short chain dehydrogenase
MNSSRRSRRKAIAIQADVSKPAAVRRLFNEAEMGGLDIVVDNAGVHIEKPLIATTARVCHPSIGSALIGSARRRMSQRQPYFSLVSPRVGSPDRTCKRAAGWCERGVVARAALSNNATMKKGRFPMKFSLVPLLINGQTISNEIRQALRENRLQDAAAILMQQYGLSWVEVGHLLDLSAYDDQAKRLGSFKQH